MEHKELTAQLRRMSVETGSLACMGCRHEDNWRYQGLRPDPGGSRAAGGEKLNE